MQSSDILSETIAWDRWLALNNAPSVPKASMRGGTGDRIVLDGYTPFLSDQIAENLDIRLESVVKRISVAPNFEHGSG